MSIFWRNASEYPDIELPQKIMRPFWHPETRRLDDQQFCVNLSVEQPKLRAYLFFAAGFIILAAASFFLYQETLSYLESQIINNEMLAGSMIGGSLLLLAVCFFYLFYRANQTRALCFKRETRSVHYTKRGLLTRHVEQDYENFQGKIETYRSLLGKRRSYLLLEHDDKKLSISLIQTQDTPQSLVGYWSFIVQYMKANAPLPDVPALHDYPNTMQGVLHQNTIDYS